MGDFGGPAAPKTVFADIDDHGRLEDLLTAKAISITFPVDNYENDTLNKEAEAWEKEFLNYIHENKDEWEQDGLSVAFMAERSIEDEIERESQGEVFTIIISYTVMFVYVSIALGEFNSCERLLLDSKIVLGLSGVLV